MKKAAACFGGILRPDTLYFLLRKRHQPYSLFHFMSSLVYVSGIGPDVEVGDGLPLLGRSVARNGALPEVQFSEHRMNLRIA